MAFRHVWSVGTVARDVSTKSAKLAYDAMIYDIASKKSKKAKKSKQTKK